MSNKMRVILFALAVVMFCAAGTVCGAEEDPAVIRVGDVVYPLSVIQYSVNSYLDLAAANGETVTEEMKEEILQQTEEHFVGMGVIENKLREAGKNDFTEDEMDIMQARAAMDYEQTWQQIYQDMKDYADDITEAEITSWLTEKGYTQEAFLQETIAQVRESRILDLYCADVTVTAEQVQRYYDEQFLEPDREKYRDNVPKYEEEVLTGNLNAFYIPEGYRYIKNILLPYPDEIVSALGIIELDGKKAYTEARKAYFELADAAAAGEDLTEVKEAYDLKIAAVRALEEEYTQKEKEALPLLAETIVSIRKQLADGISIDSLLKEYSLDQQQTGSDKPGGLYHPDSKLWPEEAHAVIGAMTEIGSLSEPYCDQQGVHLFYYAGDAPGGEAVLNAEEKDQLERSALYYYQLQRLKELISEWLPKYEVSVDFSLIRFDGR